MNPNQLKRLLRTAVLIALSVSLQTGCALPSAVCETTTESPGNPNITDTVAGVETASFETCVQLCQQAAERGAVDPLISLTIKDFKVTQCDIKPTGKGHGLLTCKADYMLEFRGTRRFLGCPVAGRMPAGLWAHVRQA